MLYGLILKVTKFQLPTPKYFSTVLKNILGTIMPFPGLKRIVFCLVVFAAIVSMPCVHIRDIKLYVSQKCSTYFSSSGMNK